MWASFCVFIEHSKSPVGEDLSSKTTCFTPHQSDKGVIFLSLCYARPMLSLFATAWSHVQKHYKTSGLLPLIPKQSREQTFMLYPSKYPTTCKTLYTLLYSPPRTGLQEMYRGPHSEMKKQTLREVTLPKIIRHGVSSKPTLFPKPGSFHYTTVSRGLGELTQKFLSSIAYKLVGQTWTLLRVKGTERPCQ